MKIAIDRGHGVGEDRGAFREEECIAIIGDQLVSDLKALGHTIVETRPTGNLTESQSINARINACNNAGVDMVFCLHFNAFNKSAHGSEVLTYKAVDKLGAKKMLARFAELGFTNRGIKDSDGVAGICKGTTAPCILIEFCFSDADSDYNLFQKVYKEMSKIVCEEAGLGSPKGGTVTPTKPPVTTTKPPDSNNQSVDPAFIKRLQTECNKQGYSNQAVDGLVGPATLAGCPQLQKGAKGEITGLMQELLINQYGISLSPYNRDCDFGATTEKGVKTFQKSKGLSSDGICGRNTWQKLLGM